MWHFFEAVSHTPRPFIFYGIPIPLIHLHGDISITSRRRVVGWDRGCDELLLNGYIYPDLNYTEWKLVVPNVCMYIFQYSSLYIPGLESLIPGMVSLNYLKLSWLCQGRQRVSDGRRSFSIHLRLKAWALHTSKPAIILTLFLCIVAAVAGIQSWSYLARPAYH